MLAKLSVLLVSQLKTICILSLTYLLLFLLLNQNLRHERASCYSCVVVVSSSMKVSDFATSGITIKG